MLAQRGAAVPTTGNPEMLLRGKDSPQIEEGTERRDWSGPSGIDQFQGATTISSGPSYADDLAAHGVNFDDHRLE